MDAESLDVNVTTLHYALAQRHEDGKWAAYFTAANTTDAKIGNKPFMSEWMDTREQAQARVDEVVKDMAELGLKVVPLKPSN